MKNSLRQMLVLAGGQGTRLQSLVSDKPKPMAPVNNRPFLAYLLDYWIGQGINLIGISVGYKAKYIKDYFCYEYNKAKIFYIEELELLGTGGAIRKAINFQNSPWVENDLMVINGDTWFEISLPKLLKDFTINNNPITIAIKYLKSNDRYGSIVINNDQLVEEFNNFQLNNSFINGGCYLINRNFFINYLKNLPEKFSFEEIALKDLANKGFISASVQNVNFLDIGVPEDYKKVNTIINKKLN